MAKQPTKRSSKQQKPKKKGAHEFLDALDQDEKLRAVIEKQNPIVEFARTQGYEFTPDELNQALHEKWGKPKKREMLDQAFTCCFSEAPGA